MINHWKPFLYKWEKLKEIWLSVYYNSKVTKTHVIECDLDSAVEDIVSSPQILGLRLSGSLLLGVTQILCRKAKYLLTDCSHALDKLNLSFRPDAPEKTKKLSCEGFEAAVKEISLSNDVSYLPDSSDFNVDMNVDVYSQNLSHAEEITIKEYSNMTINQLDMNFQTLGHPEDLFGDEDIGVDLRLDFLTSSGTHPDFTEFIPDDNETPNKYSLNQKHDVIRRDPAEEEVSLNQSSYKQTSFVLPPLTDTSSTNKKRRQRKCKLIMDQMTFLSDKVMQMQLSDDSDLIDIPIMAPPTQQLMDWKESGTAVKLLMQPCSSVIGSEIKEAFPKDVIQVTFEEEEVMREDDHEALYPVSPLSNTSPLSTESFNDSSTEHKLTEFNYSSEHMSDSELMQDEHILDTSQPELSPEYPMLIHQSHMEQHSQSLLGCQNSWENQTVYRQAHMLLKFLQRSEGTSFCLRDLCSGHTRLQVARTFQCCLMLHKEGVVNLHQSGPCHDIFLTLVLHSSS
ncbi:double-strand-break repair protein rad21-like protein 1 isoform X2 [Syngnathus scovelli]|uniref:double-strand-break repair protein rad21-like protein 1 isoform X2 n=1 Tax=Syngnathus scovelli TaxID=161590 RepID=UPI00211077F7|nr:double-strand-break repair protein rad21-like protein 1 isoform X2 [Syngnathus scovelli]